jgi:hypothetical protein
MLSRSGISVISDALGYDSHAIAGQRRVELAHPGPMFGDRRFTDTLDGNPE